MKVVVLLLFTHRVADTRDADMIYGHVYVLQDRDGQVRYIGHTNGGEGDRGRVHRAG